MAIRFDVLTLFPEIFDGYLEQSVLKRAIDAGLVEVQRHNIRDWATGPHRQVDDRPYGGGPGMVLMPGPVVACVETVQSDGPPGRLVMLSPQGRRLDQSGVEQLAIQPRILLLCGRYEGFDQRIADILHPDVVSVGDYVLSGGEVAAMVVIDAVVRLVPGVLGDEDSSRDDSFSGGERLLEYAQYTRPRVFRGQAVPEVLVSGDHEAIAEWRRQDSLARTQSNRGARLAKD
jgi:tRNA (guanine37-N1)-methyltransferase